MRSIQRISICDKLNRIFSQFFKDIYCNFKCIYSSLYPTDRPPSTTRDLWLHFPSSGPRSVYRNDDENSCCFRIVFCRPQFLLFDLPYSYAHNSHLPLTIEQCHGEKVRYKYWCVDRNLSLVSIIKPTRSTRLYTQKSEKRRYRVQATKYL